jgi:transcriptional regulator with XRE-family HTH domain
LHPIIKKRSHNPVTVKAMKTFGNFVKELRLQREITLREFCRRSGQDPSNWSKVERGINSPPTSKTIIEAIAASLEIEPGKEDYKTLFDLSAISFIPKELIEEEEILESLPLFFRTVRGDPPTEKELKELIDLIRKG